jgi:hypothetical protein
MLIGRAGATGVIEDSEARIDDLMATLSDLILPCNCLQYVKLGAVNRLSKACFVKVEGS